MDPLQNLQVQEENVKVGEIFQLRDNKFALSCIHCMQEFQYFTEFTLHIQDHYLSGDIKRFSSINDVIVSDNKPAIQTEVKEEEETFSIKLEIDESNQENECFHSDSDNLLHIQDDDTAFVCVRENREKLLSKCNSAESTSTSGMNKENNGFNLPTNIMVKDDPEIDVDKNYQQSVTMNLMRQHEYDNKVYCPLCKLRSARLSNLKRHIERIHGITDTNTIDAMLADQIAYIKGKRSLSRDQKVIPYCPVCSMRFSKLFSLKRHLQNIHGIFDLSLEEKSKNLNFAEVALIEQIENIEALPETYECFICHQQFTTTKLLMEHMECDHKVAPYCPLCSARSSRLCNLRRHIRRVHGITETNKINVILADQITHPRKKHAIPAYQKVPPCCPVCSLRVVSFFNLKRHLKNVHGWETSMGNFHTILAAEEKLKNLNIGELAPFAIIARLENSEPLPEIYECFICHQQFSTMNSLQQHMQGKFHKEVPFCSKCSLSFSNLFNLKRHIRRVHGITENFLIDAFLSAQMESKKYVANWKNEEVSPSVSIDANGNSESTSEQFDCSECLQQFATMNLLRRHIQYEHKKTLSCPVCLLRVSNLYNLKRHLQNIHGICGQKINAICAGQRKTKNLNIEEIAAIEKKANLLHLPEKFECFECHQQFAIVTLLRNHMRHGHKEYDEPFCSLCSIRFTRPYTLKKHIESIHGGKKKLCCPSCLSHFCNTFNLKRHLRNIHGYEPNEIDKMLARQPKLEIFNEPNNLLSTKPQQSNESFMCEICGSTFVSHQRLKFHLDSHNNTNKFNCKLCGKIMSIKSAKRHMGVHRGEKNYQCGTCGDRFLNKNRLGRHMVHHFREPKFKCTLCDKTFIRSIKLQEHRRTHNEEMPYVCKTCKKVFNSFKSLKTHEFKHNCFENEKELDGMATV